MFAIQAAYRLLPFSVPEAVFTASMHKKSAGSIGQGSESAQTPSHVPEVENLLCSHSFLFPCAVALLHKRFSFMF